MKDVGSFCQLLSQFGEVLPAFVGSVLKGMQHGEKDSRPEAHATADTTTALGAMQGDMRRSQGLDLSIPVALLHVAAFSMGYFICKGLGFNEKTARTVSIETGTQLWTAAFPFGVCTMALAAHQL